MLRQLRWSNRVVIFLVVLVLVVAISIFYLLGLILSIYEGATSNQVTAIEAIATDISAMAAIFALAAAFVAGYFTQREWTAAQRAARQGMHADLLKAYNQAKAVRRNLRALSGGGNTATGTLQRGDYLEQLKALNEAQLVFETYKKRAENQTLWFSDGDTTLLRKALCETECYLNEIVGEYEDKLGLFSGVSASLPLGYLDKLADFIDPAKKGIFNERFGNPTDRILKYLWPSTSRRPTVWQESMGGGVSMNELRPEKITSRSEDFLLKEHELLTETLLRNEELGERRLAFFTTFATAVTGAIATLAAGLFAAATSKDGSQLVAALIPVAFPLGLLILLIVLLLGLATLERLIHRNRKTDEYATDLRAIRQYFGQDPRVRPYLPFQPFGKVKPRTLAYHSLGNGGLVQMVAIVNGFIVGVLFIVIVLGIQSLAPNQPPPAQGVNGPAWSSWVVPLAFGFSGFLGAWCGQVFYANRQYGKYRRSASEDGSESAETALDSHRVGVSST